MKKILLLFLLIILTGCGTVDNTNIIVNDSAQTATVCEFDSDCQLPFDYAIRSSCPFETACKDESCWVVCPMWQDKTSDQAKAGYDVACENDNDCDCSDWDTQAQYDCLCHDKQCASFVEKINE